MNRPFSAFTSLMALLALAMFAVSSTTRSTSVQPPPAARQTVRTHHQVMKVVSNKPVSSDQQVTSTPMPASLIPSLDSPALKGLSKCSAEPKSLIQSVSIEVAEQVVVNLPPVPTRDDFSRDDSLCDWSVHDVRSAAASHGAGGLDQAAVESANLPDELNAIFNDLVSRRATPSPQAGATHLPRKAIRWNPLLAAAEAWIKYQWLNPTQTELPSNIDWDDYSEFAADLPAQSKATPIHYWISDESVRSGGLLRHSAASSLHAMTSTDDDLSGEVFTASDSLSD